LNKDADRSTGESCIFHELLGETLRPGGLELTAHVSGIADIKADELVLDIGCGKGTTATFLAEEKSCRVAGIDLSAEMVSSSQAKAAERHITDRVKFLVADGEYLPFRDSSFDLAISECTFSLLSDQGRAAEDIQRVLKPQGRFVFTDIVLRGKVDPNLRGQIGFPCCMSGSASTEEYLELFKKSGFDPYYVEDQSNRLAEIGFRLCLALGDLNQGPNHILEGPCHKKGQMPSSTSPEMLWDFLKQSKPGYTVIIMKKI
jgi:arsenite methyltransferase